uniref:Uncharacterized protein n=1 Tax=Pithovirus LCPAC401 TaxID=2506595 RepID=A0A481ZC23_9VIRU|nr:MAG: hypothetical protein LCPAC401_03280 [Pithovirus LCPAC401]
MIKINGENVIGKNGIVHGTRGMNIKSISYFGKEKNIFKNTIKKMMESCGIINIHIRISTMIESTWII